MIAGATTRLFLFSYLSGTLVYRGSYKDQYCMKMIGEIGMKEPIKRVRNLADYGYPSNDVAALSEKALEITRRLTELYGELPFSSKDPMGMLVDILLSHRTRDEQTAAAWENLLKRFGSWEGVRDAPTAEVENAIANVNWPEVKAPRIQTIMRQITEERGNLDLTFLRELPLEEAAAWLNRFEGVGPKTTACAIVPY